MPALRLLEAFVRASDTMAVHLRRMPVRAAHLELGSHGEEAAYFFLRRRGMIVVARGWRSGKARGDLDLIGWERDTLCFVEVKTRSSRHVATAEAAVDDDKKRVLRRLARHYLRALPSKPEATRFDILSIYYEGHTAKPDIEWLRGAFHLHQEERDVYRP